ncbi:restriction endonuclease subunit S [Caloramator sp. CAR-1]|uniref:restriction endonuclease subunit S n=1 Tax=Caloramator sp. CAR-1 TaxID=3062777 RepID=UPI0026E352F7|nr:restriction endonuclease subunit S [Caloramator sp. CAR-1]MDO6353885.1 restriction endonuclease subunit S [Caloramator sp. CAR-1]
MSCNNSFQTNYLFSPIYYADDWKCKILYDLATWKNGLAFKNKDFSKAGRPIIKIAELKNGITPQTKYTNKFFDEAALLKKGDLLFSWSGNPDTSIDVFWFDLPEGWLNQHIFKITVDERIADKKYFYYLLKYLKPNFKAIASNKQTTGLGHVTISDLKNIIIKLPPLHEQKAIAKILSDLDEKIEINNRINKVLEEIAQTIFKRWFIDFEFPNENGEPYKSSGGEMVDSELGPIPKGWEVGRLGEYISFVKGKKPKNIIENKIDGYVEYLTIDVLSNNSRLFADPEKMVIVENKNNMMVMDGASSGTIYFGFKGIVASTLAKIEVINNKLNDDILYFILKYYENDIKNHTTGSAIPHADKEYIKRLSIAFPQDNELINQYFRLSKNIRNQIYIIIMENQNLSQLRDALLPKLMSGEIRVDLNNDQIVLKNED